MKKCPTCQEEFSDQFKFCPVDSTLLSNGHDGATPDTVTLNAAPRESYAAPGGNGAGDAGTETVAASAAPFVGAGAQGNGNGHGAAAGVAAGQEREEFHFTFISEEGLTRRLLRELKEVGQESQLTWPEFKRDPVGFTKRGAAAYGGAVSRTVKQPNVAAGLLAALAIMLLGGGLLATGANWGRLKCDYLLPLFGKRCSTQELAQVREDLEFQGMVTDVPKEQPTPDKGTAGTAKGTGGGSKPKQDKPHGGGGGGREEQKPASAGKLPPASLDIPQVRAPDPHPPTVKNPNLPVPASIVADPVLFPPDPRNIPYGDPKSKSTETSSGPGTGGGIGSGTGGGVGPGEGGGVGPGRGGNTGGGDRHDGGGGPGGGGGGTDYDKVFRPGEVTRRAQIIDRPEPLYTEEARKNQITGSVRVRMVLNANGSVTGVQAVSRLPDGLTEKAIEAAHRIKFSPAEKDGRKVSQYVTIDYNFNIY
ncbi:MAG TPA: energy transducer TonB [Pyrinomonadaceae bacterium]|jgi:TonB family protein